MSLKYVTKPGAHGPLYLYEIRYTDPTDDGIGEMAQRLYAYNIEHALDRFYGAADAPGWRALRVARVRADRVGMHRAIWYPASFTAGDCL